MTVQERFESRYTPEPNSGCWLWMGRPATVEGYGAMFISGKSRRAHRVAMALYRRFDLDDPALILHHCDTPACVNPAHLFIGDNFANMRDAAAKGRLHCQKQPLLYCKRGHARTPENLAVQIRNGRPLKSCRVCRSDFRRKGVWP